MLQRAPMQDNIEADQNRSEGSQDRIEAGPAGQDRERTGSGTTGYLQDGCMQDRKGMNKTCG